MRKLLSSLTIVTFVISSCSKQEAVIQKDSSKLSLEEFIAKSNGSDKQFLSSTKITKNLLPLGFKLSKLASNTEVGPDDPIEPIEADLVAWPKVKFRWSGSENGCKTPLGICLIWGAAEEAEEPSEEEIAEPIDASDAKITILGDKLILEPLTSDNGLTSDNYLPIASHIQVNENYMIKPGIYQGTPERVIVDVIKIN